MKSKQTAFTLTTAALLVLGAGCNKQDSAAQQDLKQAGDAASVAVKDAAAAVRQAGETAVKDVTKQAEKLASPASSKAQEIIDGAKKLFNDGKLQEALAKLKELGGEKLSAEQQTIADGLKAQIDKLVGATSKTATDAAKAVGNPGK